MPKLAPPLLAMLSTWLQLEVVAHVWGPCQSSIHMDSAGLVYNILFGMVQGRGEGSRKGVSRRLVLTAGALLERRPATYEVAERRHLAALAAVVRFAVEPTWLGLEWTDGAPAAMYILPGRDALLAALLDAAPGRTCSNSNFPDLSVQPKYLALASCNSSALKITSLT